MEQTLELLDKPVHLHPLDVAIRPSDADLEVRLIILKGDVDLHNATVLSHALTSVINSGAHYILLDFSAVRYMDSSGFGTLFSALKRLRPINGSLHLIHCHPIIKRMLEITRLNTVLSVHENELEARLAVEKLRSVASK